MSDILYLSRADVTAAAGAGSDVFVDAVTTAFALHARRETVILLNSMGMAVIDVACAKAVHDRAVAAKIGTWLPR